MPITPQDIKHWLRESQKAGRTSYGFFAEYLYAVTMSRHCDVKSEHSGGVDFVLDGTTKVDVKSRICLDSNTKQFPREPDSSRSQGVTYPHVIFYDDLVTIYDTESKSEKVIEPIAWEKVCSIAADYMKKKTRRLYIPGDNERTEANMKTLKNLEGRIREHWKLNPKMVRRSSPGAMKGMNNSGWGPEAFFLYPRDQEYDLVVLVYFDGEADYEVCAYPRRLSHEIAWSEKPVGPNKNKRMTFDPRILPSKFRFKDIEDFKKNFPDRFPA
jgi:hypothetical protein